MGAISWQMKCWVKVDKSGDLNDLFYTDISTKDKNQTQQNEKGKRETNSIKWQERKIERKREREREKIPQLYCFFSVSLFFFFFFFPKTKWPPVVSNEKIQRSSNWPPAKNS